MNGISDHMDAIQLMIFEKRFENNYEIFQRFRMMQKFADKTYNPVKEYKAK